MKIISTARSLTAGKSTSGFNALLSGSRGPTGKFYQLNKEAFWWSSTEVPSTGTRIWGRFINNRDTKVERGSLDKSYGYHVRCIKD
ncbi:MAG: FISUMP domain-containing protein [Bacteroidales bacterium]|nr:hypothetical protein [Bacteroidales bacterium]MDD2425538.1 FISUMP domain-containing protein [Bacteroidales bacterium]MDD3989997.1 FISUMP domain-containing protein [Bacteroidales bacterium]MDD4638181.1 FISUMP domain-containing protein [Bacteroidales bacterium]